VRHAIFQHQVGKVGETKERRFLAAQFDNAHDNRAVIAAGGGAAHRECLVDLVANRALVEVGHHREVVRRLQREAPALHPLALRAFPRAGDGRGRQPGQVGLVGEDEFEGVGRVQDVLRELGGDPRQLDVDLLQPFLAGGFQIGAVTAEGVDGLVQEAPPGARESRGRRAGGVGLDVIPQAGVQRNAGVEGADLGLRGVEGGAQFGVSGDAFQVAHHTHGPIQRLGHRVQGKQRAVEGWFAIGGGERCEAGAGLPQQLAGGGLHVLRPDAVERNAEFHFEKRVAVVGERHYLQA
jgi:hypothetical protein